MGKIDSESAEKILVDQDKAVMDALFRLAEDQQEIVEKMKELEEEVLYWKEQTEYWMCAALGRDRVVR